MKIWRKNRILGIILAVLTVGGVLTGCQQNAPAKEGDSSTNPNSPPATLTVEVFDRGKSGQPSLNDNLWTKYINENFGKQYNATVEFVAVPRTQEVDKLNVLMAADEAPDISFTYDAGTVYNYVTQGGLAQLDDPIEKYGQNLKKYLGEDILKYGNFDGKQYSIPGKRTVLMYANAFIRKDWLDKLNMEVPTTSDELYDALVAFRDQNPGNVDGVVPLAYSIPGGNIGGDILESIFYTDLSEETIAKYTLNTVSLLKWKMPGYKDYMQFMNKLYNEKLLSPDFALDKTNDQANADLSGGKSGVVFSAVWDHIYRSSPGIYENIKKIIPDAELIPLELENSSTGKYSKMTYHPYSAYIIVPKASKNVELAVKFLDWMSDLKNIRYLQSGEEGVDYNLEDGIAVPITDKVTPVVEQKSLGGDYCMIVGGGTETGDDTKNIRASAIGYKKAAAVDDIMKAAEASLRDGYTSFYFSVPNSAQAKYSKTLTEKTAQMTAQLITCKPSEFSALYDSQVEEYMQAGGQAVVDENIKNYQTQTGKTLK